LIDVEFGVGIGESGADIAGGFGGDVVEASGIEHGEAGDEILSDGRGLDGVELPDFETGLERFSEVLDGLVAGGEEEDGAGEVVEVTAEFGDGGGRGGFDFVNEADGEAAVGGVADPVADDFDVHFGTHAEVEIEFVAGGVEAELLGDGGFGNAGRTDEEVATLDGIGGEVEVHDGLEFFEQDGMDELGFADVHIFNCRFQIADWERKSPAHERRGGATERKAAG